MTALSAPAWIGGRWQSLDDTIAGKHSTIHREVPADHKGSHGGILLGQDIRFVCKIRLVLTAIYQDKAGIAAVISVALVRRVCPPSATAET